VYISRRMNGLAIWFAFSFCLLLASLSSLTHASDREVCERNLVPLGEFAQRPNDREQGLVTKRVSLSPETLVAAYHNGIFPWQMAEDGNAVWHSPPERGILFLDQVHISKSDMDFIKKASADPDYEVTVDKAFNEVMTECAEMIRWRKNANGIRTREGQWISPEFIRNFTALFARGYAHSVEVWHNGILVGGLYGTFVDGVFAGESMFHKESNVTKLAMYTLIQRLKANGHTFIDTQQAKALSEKWGAVKVSRAEFKQMLRQAQAANRPF
jgi:leucyl/phenylalanyl-tRNA---protein transferase